MTRSSDRLRKLLQRNRTKLRAAELVRLWSARSVTASVMADDRHWKLIDRLRGGRSWPLDHVANLEGAVRPFIGRSDLVTVMGWNIEEEPPLLMSAQSLGRASHHLASIYPDGFILVDDKGVTALMVDIDDEEGVHTTTIELPI